MKNIAFCFLCLFVFAMFGCGIKGAKVAAGDDKALVGEWEVVGEEEKIDRLCLRGDKIEYRNIPLSPLRIFKVIIHEISNVLFVVKHKLGTTRILVVNNNLLIINDNLLFVYPKAIKRAGIHEEEVGYSEFIGKWKSEDGKFAMEIREGKVSFNDEPFDDIFGVFKVCGDYVFISEIEFDKRAFALKVSGESVSIFGEFSGELRRKK